jgi:hypothetical protein
MIGNEIVHCLNALGIVAKEQHLFRIHTYKIKNMPRLIYLFYY